MSKSQTHFSKLGLYTGAAERKYLNDQEHSCFVSVAASAPQHERLFALTLAYTGVRLSEARLLTIGNIQLDNRVLAVRSLKRRETLVVREIPIPEPLAQELSLLKGDPDELIWQQQGKPIPRITAYRWIKRCMERAGISGPKACPKGLRHAFGTRAVMSGVPLNMVQRWMGHASMTTTAMYATVLGPEQLQLADQMWKQKS